MLKTFFSITTLLSFILGAYAWKILHSSHNYNRASGLNKHQIRRSQVLVEIEGSNVTTQDVDFEYTLMTDVLNQENDMTSIPDFGLQIDQELSTLKVNILNSIVERKMLYHVVKQDVNFDINNSNRYVKCLSEWMKLIESNKEIFLDADDRTRLKSRLCENSILKQYVEEVVYSKIKIDDKSLLEYFKNHKGEFTLPALVEISQIVLAEEKQAKRVRAKVRRSNFSRMAKTHSITPEAVNGGNLKPFPMGYGMPRFFEVAFTMKPGQISSILKSTYGFHIILLKRKTKSRVLSFKDASKLILKKLLLKKKEKAYNKWVDIALHSTKVSTPKVNW